MSSFIRNMAEEAEELEKTMGPKPTPMVSSVDSGNLEEDNSVASLDSGNLDAHSWDEDNSRPPPLSDSNDSSYDSDNSKPVPMELWDKQDYNLDFDADDPDMWA
jgi:hypothetical protein